MPDASVLARDIEPRLSRLRLASLKETHHNLTDLAYAKAVRIEFKSPCRQQVW